MDPITNFAYSSVTVAPSPATSGTTLEVADVSLFPAVGDYNLVVWPAGAFPLASNAEIVRVTAISGSQFTITRAQEGTVARTIVVGDQIGQNVTEKYLTDIGTALIAVNVTGNTAGTPALLSSGTVVFSGGANITLSQNGQTIGIIGGAGAGGGVALYDGANSITSGTARFTNANGVSFTFNGQTISGSVRTDYQSSGNYLTTAMLSNAVTLSNIRVSAGTTSNLLSALTFADGSGVSWGLNASTITASVATNYQSQGAYLTTAALSQDSSKYAGTNGAITGGSITVNTSGVSVNLPAYLTTAMASNRGSDFVQATAVFNGTNATGTIASNAISVSVAAQTVQTQNFIAASLSGNTAGALALISSGTMIFAGGNNITLSQNGQSVTISGANAGGAQTAISGIIASDATYTSGSVYLSGQNNITIGSSVDGASQYVRFSVGNYLTTAMASNRGSDFVQATAVFNGTNATGTIASGAISVSVAAPIPIGTSVNPVASASSVGTVTRYAPEDHRHPGIGAVGISTSGNTAGTTGSVIGTYWFEGGNSITVSQITSNNGSHTLRLSVGNYLTTAMASGASTQFVQANAGFNGTNASGTIASNSISVSVAAPIPIGTSVNAVASASSVGTVTRYAPEDHRHAGIGAVGISTSGNTAGTTGSVVGTYWFEGGNSITVSQITSNNGSHTLRLSVGNYLTTAMASGASTQFVQANAGFNGTNASGTIASNSISVSVAAPIPIGTSVKAVASASSVGTITRYAPEDHAHAGVAAYAITNTGNTLGNTRSNVGTFYLAASGAITASQSTGAAGNDTLWLSVNSQTNQSLGLYMSSNTTSSVSSGTVDARSMTFRGVGVASVGYSNGEVIISVPAGGGGITAINVSAGTTSNNLSALTFADSGGVSWGINASTVTATVATYSTVGTATTVKSVASANSVGTVTRWAAEDHAHGGVGGIGISTAGNSAGTSGSQIGTYWLQGGNNVTISQITSNNGSHTAIISGERHATLSHYGNLPNGFIDAASTLVTCGGSVLQVVPFTLPNALSGLYFRVPVSMSYVSTEVSGTTVNTTHTVNRGYTQAIAIMTQNVGASSLSLVYSTSTSATWLFQNVVGAAAQGSRYTVTQNVSYPISGTTSNYTTSYAQSSANVQISSASMTLFTGPRYADIPFGISLSPGNYWAVFGQSTSSATTGGQNSAIGAAGAAFSTAALSLSALSWGYPGAVTNSSIGVMPGLGSWSTNAAVISSSSLQLASVSIQSNNPQIGFQIDRFA